MKDNNKIIDSQKNKIKILNKKGHSCYEYKYKTTGSIAEIRNTKNLKKISAAGRIISLDKESMSGELLDFSGKLKFYLENSSKLKDTAKFLDLGDIVGLSGYVDKKERFICTSLVFLTKTLLPLNVIKEINFCPHKLKHLDLILNHKTRETLLLRNKVIGAIRSFLSENEFLEIDTPSLQPFQGDSTALPLFTDVTSCDMRFALASSPELYLKKLLVGGLNKVFAIGKNFRDEKTDSTHLIEFLSVEYYQAYVDYRHMMKFTEDLFRYVLLKTKKTTKINYNGHLLDFGKKWKKISIQKSLNKMFGVNVFSLPLESLLKIASGKGIIYNRTLSRGNVIINIFDRLIGCNIIQPTFVIDYPVDATVMCYDITMAKAKKREPNVLERFEFFVGGLELANCYSELNDPDMQYKAFNNFLKARNKKLKLDPNFYHALCVGLPPSSGVGFGIDRLIMIINDNKNIYETISFSTYHESKE